MNRIRDGFFVRINPFNTKQRKAISLKPEDVDVIVFWTKNPRPLMKYLHILDEEGYRYYFQFTLNDYPNIIEPGVPPISQRIETFKELAESIGKGRVVWRFDPIVLSTVTPLEYLQDRFAYLAAELDGCTERVVISFFDVYGKVKSRIVALEKNHGVKLYDITAPEFRQELLSVVEAISQIASRHSIDVFTCSENMDLSKYGIPHGRCIDNELIEGLFGRNVSARKDKAQRSECLCVEAVDMGIYNTCPAGCVYCYARTSAQGVKRNVAKHDPASPVLVGKCDAVDLPWDDRSDQLKLF